MFTESPQQTHDYRFRKLTVFNKSQQYCAVCKTRRSLTQFDAGSAKCKRCVLRGI